MTHRHKIIKGIGGGWYCDICENWFTEDELIKRFHATEFLSAEDAEDAAREVRSPVSDENDCLEEALRNYAKTLMGE